MKQKASESDISEAFSFPGRWCYNYSVRVDRM